MYPQGRILIIVPTTALVDQWFVSLQEDLGVPHEMIAIFSGEEKPKQPSIINIMVINSARKMAPIVSSAGETFLIVDECHRAGSPVNVRSLYGEHQAVLGLSATPQRDYDSGFEENLVPALGPIVYDYDYEQAFVDGVITPFELINVRVDLLPDEQHRVARITKSIASVHQQSELHNNVDERLKRLLLRRAAIIASATMRVPVASKLVEMNRGQRTLVFHERIQAADTILAILTDRGHSTTVYHSRVGPFVRRSNLRLYRRGIFDVLVTCRALDEGLNVPETSIAIIASSTASSRQRIQRLGRVLRPAPGKNHATIFTIYASDQEEQRLLSEAQQLKEIVSVHWQRSFATK